MLSAAKHLPARLLRISTFWAPAKAHIANGGDFKQAKVRVLGKKINKQLAHIKRGPMRSQLTWHEQHLAAWRFPHYTPLLLVRTSGVLGVPLSAAKGLGQPVLSAGIYQTAL